LEIADAPILQSEKTASPQNLILASLGERYFSEILYSVLFWGSFYVFWSRETAQNVKIIAYIVKEFIVVGS